MTFGEKLKALRKARGLTLQDVGDCVRVGKSTVRKWETGEIANVRRDKIDLIAEALHVNPAYLMGWTDDPVDYSDPDLIASIPLSYMEACSNDVKKAYAMMIAVDEERDYPQEAASASSQMSTDAHGITPDDEVWQIREEMRRNPELRTLYDLQRKATKTELKQIKAFIRAIRSDGHEEEDPN